MPEQIRPDAQEISLDTVFNAIKHWRANKKDYDNPGIPDSIWNSVFQLEDNGYGKSELRRLFGLNSQQYNKKRDRFDSTKKLRCDDEPVKTSKDNKQNHQEPAALFAQAIVDGYSQQNSAPPLTSSTEKTKQAVKHLKSPDKKPEKYLDNTTIIVECIRDDGHRLKIHMTTCRLETLMQSFFNYGDIAV